MNDDYYMGLAIKEAKKSKDSDGYHVGAVIVKNKKIIARAYSDETKNKGHAEELVIKKVRRRLHGATIYVTMEPCSFRPSGRASCVDLILSHGIRKVVYGTKDPEIEVPCNGIKTLTSAGIKIVHLKELEEKCREITSGLF